MKYMRFLCSTLYNSGDLSLTWNIERWRNCIRDSAQCQFLEQRWRSYTRKLFDAFRRTTAHPLSVAQKRRPARSLETSGRPHFIRLRSTW
jgi:hypothetical protein